MNVQPGKNVSNKQRVCHYCGERTYTTWDHVVPKAIGGTDRIENLVRCCGPCNSNKADEWPTCTCGGCERARRLYEWDHPHQYAHFELLARLVIRGESS